MSSIDSNRFLYEHEGTLQSERLERAPSPESMKVSDLSFEDLIKRSAEFASKLKFYNDENEPDGDWQSFFALVYDGKRVKTEVLQHMMDTASVPPHLALMLAFYKLVLIEQENINTLTDRQMSYYFEQVLGFRKRTAVEGNVTVFAELNKNTKSVRVAKGTLFNAGKDENGKLIAYEAVDECVVGPENVGNLMLDGGYSVKVIPQEKDALDPVFALCITSDILAHPVCKRTLSLRLRDGSKILNVISKFKAQYTSPEGWTDLPYDDFQWIAGEDMPEMVPPLPDVHTGCPASDAPVIRFIAPYGPGSLTGVDVSEITGIQLNVEDWVPETLNGKYGVVENKPGIDPFGASNRMGDYFDVVLKHPAISVTYSSPFGNEVGISMDAQIRDGGFISVRYQLNSDNNCQEVLSNNYASAILKWMEDPESEELSAAAQSKLIAVTPILSNPVMLTAAVFQDSSFKCALQHSFGAGVWGAFKESISQYRLNGSGSALYFDLSGISGSSRQACVHISMDTDSPMIPASVNWDYFDGASWCAFAKSDILKDKTSGLSRSGICQFDLQKAVSESVLTDDILWIRGVCDNANAGNVLSAQSRALELSYSPDSEGKGPEGEALPAGSVTKPVMSIPGLKAVSQPSDGNEGKRKESDSHFRARVSEHLRHKGRAWSPWDYEALILENFPQIAFARCLPTYSDYGTINPGEVTVQVIPASSPLTLQPGATALQISEIKEMIKSVCSPFVTVNIKNPDYIPIHIRAALILRPGYNDTVYYRTKTIEALDDYLRPWIGSEGSGQHFTLGDSVADIIAFLESLPFVDHVEVPIGVNVNSKKVELDDAITLSSPLQMFTSGGNHDITCKLAQ